MGAGQIGGIATLLDFNFNNAAGFVGRPASNIDGQYIVYYFSHAMLFCAGALVEPHMVVTPALCVYGEDVKFEVYAGSHRFQENYGAKRSVESVCTHRHYNHSAHWTPGHCYTDNIALLVLDKQFIVRYHEPQSEYIINRLRYGVPLDALIERNAELQCHYYGWGSRRNGFLLPLLIDLHRVDVTIRDHKYCQEMWNVEDKYLCLSQPHCIDDLGSVVVCGGYLQGMMTSELIDRPCGAGFLNMALYFKFLTCAVDDSRDAIQDSPPLPPFSPFSPESKMKMVTANSRVSDGSELPTDLERELETATMPGMQEGDIPTEPTSEPRMIYRAKSSPDSYLYYP